MHRSRSVLARALILLAVLVAGPAYALTAAQLCPANPGSNPICTCAPSTSGCICTLQRDFVADPSPPLCHEGTNDGRPCTAHDCPAGACGTQRVCRGGPRNAEPCASAQECGGGTCPERTCQGGTNPGTVCTSNAQCRGPGAICGGLCREGTFNGRACRLTANNCPSGVCDTQRDSVLDFVSGLGGGRNNCSFVLAGSRSLRSAGGGFQITARELTMVQNSRLKVPGPATLSVQTTGPVRIQSGSTASLDVSGAVPGQIAIKTTGPTGTITVGGVVDASTAAFETDGGVITIDGASDVHLQGTGRIRAGGGGDGFGGDVTLLSGGRLTIDGPIDAAGSDFGGGLLDLEADGDLVVNAEITVTGDTGDAFLSSSGNLTLRGPLRAAGIGPEACGADVDLRASGNLVVELPPSQKLDLGGPACGGALFASADIAARIAALIDVKGGVRGDGGEVAVNSQGTVTMQGDVVADGGAGGGAVVLTGCRVVVAPGADMAARGSGGATLLQVSGTAEVRGTLTAGGSNTLERLSTTTFSVTGAVVPPLTVTENPRLTPCGGSTTTTTTSTTTTTRGGGSTTTTTTGGGGSTTTIGGGGSTAPTSQPPTTVTSTTLAQLVCDPPDCNDNDLCTSDACTAAGCIHGTKLEFEAVVCRLDGIEGELAQVTGSLKGKFVAKVRKIRSLVESRKFGSLKRAGKLLAAFARTAGKALGKGKIDPTVGGRLRDLALDAQTMLRPLIRK